MKSLPKIKQRDAMHATAKNVGKQTSNKSMINNNNNKDCMQLCLKDMKKQQYFDF